MKGHEFDPLVMFCVNCGAGMDEVVDYGVHCHPTVAGARFTQKARDNALAFVNPILDKLMAEGLA